MNGAIPFAAKAIVPVGVAVSLTFARRYLKPSVRLSARGHFTLTHEVRWENARIPAGDYEFSCDVSSIAPVLSLTKISGTRASFILLVQVIDESKPKDTNRLVLESTPSGSYVSAMHLLDFGMSLHFVVPAHAAERQIARATVPGTGQ